VEIKPAPFSLKRAFLNRVRFESPSTFLSRSGEKLFVIGTILALAVGVRLSALEQFTPEEGVGYWLGIAGGAAMLLLLLYPLRKRAKFMATLGSPAAWFSTHMMLGVIGPVLILYHSNFSLGATNSNVALFSMLFVAISGIAGRYFYGRIHNGLYGAKTNLGELLDSVTAQIADVEKDVGGANGMIAQQLTDFGTRAFQHGDSLVSNLVHAIRLPFEARRARARILGSIRHAIKSNASTMHWSYAEKRAFYNQARDHVGLFMRGVAKAAELSFYERLFGLWHVLHVPLFFLLILSGIAHVIAVHLY
jgi:hypothetical protein